MDLEVEHQITQPEQQHTIMETCYEEHPMGEDLHNRRSLNEVPKLKNKVNNNTKEVIHSSQGIKNQGRRISKEIKTTTNQIMDQVTSLNTTRDIAKTMAINLHIRDNTNLFQIKLLCSSLESILA